MKKHYCYTSKREWNDLSYPFLDSNTRYIFYNHRGYDT